MNYNLMKNNKVTISGEVVSEPEFSHEVYTLVLCPSFGVTVAHDAVVAFGLHERFGCLVPASSILEVKDQCRVLCFREGVTVYSHTRGCCHFGLDAVSCQRYAVVAYLCCLLCAVGR